MLLLATGASGGGVNLSWNDCGLAGSTNQAFACNSNAGAPFVMFASFDPNADIAALVGVSAAISIESASAQVPSWWQFSDPGTCRENAISLNASFVSGPFACSDPWAGAATGSHSYLLGYGGPNTAQIFVSLGIPEGLAGPVVAGTEYYAFAIRIDRSKTAGTGACSECLTPVCIVLDMITLHQPSGLGDQCLLNPRDRNFVAWQGGYVGWPGCPSFPHPGVGCTTPTLRNTWGQIKSLYR